MWSNHVHFLCENIMICVVILIRHTKYGLFISYLNRKLMGLVPINVASHFSFRNPTRFRSTKLVYHQNWPFSMLIHQHLPPFSGEGPPRFQQTPTAPFPLVFRHLSRLNIPFIIQENNPQCWMMGEATEGWARIPLILLAFKLVKNQIRYTLRKCMFVCQNT